MKRLVMAVALLAAGSSALAAPVAQRVDIDWRRGEHCTAKGGPAFVIQVDGLKDRTGRLMAELYPAAQNDFLKDDVQLHREGKVFRRVIAMPPRRGPVTLCIDAPAPGRYALVVIHDRDGKMKFDIWKDGVGVAGSDRLGTTQPTAEQAAVSTSWERRSVKVHMQYMRSAEGFGTAESGAARRPPSR